LPLVLLAVGVSGAKIAARHKRRPGCRASRESPAPTGRHKSRQAGRRPSHTPAQGNSLGHGHQENHQPQRGGTNPPTRSLRDETRRRLCRPFRACFVRAHANPGRCPGLACCRAVGPHFPSPPNAACSIP
jgi:hypothetical protein